MKKRPVHSHNSKKTKNLLLLLIAGLLVILLGILYVLNTSPNLQLSPASEGAGLDNAKSILNVLGPGGKDWYCGKTSTFKDLQGNVYTEKERAQLETALGSGNKPAICGTSRSTGLKSIATATPNPTSTQTPAPTAQPTAKPSVSAFPKSSGSP